MLKNWLKVKISKGSIGPRATVKTKNKGNSSKVVSKF